MSWGLFKIGMKSRMQFSDFKSVEDFADLFVNQYDLCIKRGRDNVTLNSVIKGNTELMKSTLINVLYSNTQKTTNESYFTNISDIGKAVIVYWTGVELGKIPPLIPAPGTIANVSVTSNSVINPGKWPVQITPVIASTTPDMFLNTFVMYASLHLQSISGICNTISQYPPPAATGPAVLPWQGYTITP